MFSGYNVHITVQSMSAIQAVRAMDAAIASVYDDMAFCDVLTQCLETEE